MEIGLYKMKYPLRKLIAFLLPFFRDTNPNNLSWFVVLIGIVMACLMWQGLAHQDALALFLAVVLGLARMIISTLDGLVAIEFNKSSVTGDVVNRVTPEICDLILYPTLILSLGHFDFLGIAVITMSWAISYFGLLGAASGCPVQSVGPAGQTDRLAALMLFACLQVLSMVFHWQIPFMEYFLSWALVGGAITLVLRTQRTFRAAKQKDLGLEK